MEDLAEQRLTDDDGSQTDDDGTAAHTHVRKALILRQQRTGQSHQAVGEHQAQHRVEAGVDALGTAHVGVCTGGADAAAQLGAEEPVHDADQNHRNDAHHHQRVAQRKFFHPAQRDEYAVFVHVDGLVGLAHDFQVDGVE